MPTFVETCNALNYMANTQINLFEKILNKIPEQNLFIHE